jgi:integrase
VNLSDAVGQYLADRRARGMKVTTLRNHRTTLQLLLADVGNIQTRNLRPQHVDLFWSNRTTWGPGTMNRARSDLNSFFVWCQNRGHIARDMDLLAQQRAFKVPPRDRTIIPQSEFSTFLESIEDPRARAMSAIGLYLFLRISEIAGLRWQDFNFDNDTVEVFRTKTNTVDILPLCEELITELKHWKLMYAATVGETVKRSWFVIPSVTRPTGNAVPGTKGFVSFTKPEYLPRTKARLDRLMLKVLTDSGYYKPFEGGHTFRRSGATALYEQLSSVGHDRAIRVCQAMLGHANIATTEIYLRLSLDRKLRNDLLAGKRMFPSLPAAQVVRLNTQETVDGQSTAGGI